MIVGAMVAHVAGVSHAGFPPKSLGKGMPHWTPVAVAIRLDVIADIPFPEEKHAFPFAILRRSQSLTICPYLLIPNDVEIMWKPYGDRAEHHDALVLWRPGN